MAATKGKGKAKKARNEKGSEGQEKLANKAYEKELARLHGELVKLQLWVVAKGLRVVVVFEGRDGAGKGGRHQGDHRACQSARLPSRRAARPDRARKVADVYSAIPAAFSGRRRDRDL